MERAVRSSNKTDTGVISIPQTMEALKFIIPFGHHMYNCTIFLRCFSRSAAIVAY